VGFFDTKQFDQIAAQTLVSNKDYGLAISYCLSAEDWRGVGRVVDSVLDEYVINGSAFFFILWIIKKLTCIYRAQNFYSVRPCCCPICPGAANEVPYAWRFCPPFGFHGQVCSFS
jgi:hypothetical protein